MANFNAYIDEAGDEGWKDLKTPGTGSSEWLVLAAVIVPEEDDLVRSRIIDTLRIKLGCPPPKPLHFRRLNHAKKRAAMDTLAAEPLTFSIVAIAKPHVPTTTALCSQKSYLYNYAARFLIERLTWMADDAGRGLNLFFEHRASTSYADVDIYMQNLQNDPACQIRKNTIKSFKPVPSTMKLVQAADFYASAVFNALEPDSYGNYEFDYLRRVRAQIYKRNGNVKSYGFKVFPNAGRDPKRYPWMAG